MVVVQDPWKGGWPLSQLVKSQGKLLRGDLEALWHGGWVKKEREISGGGRLEVHFGAFGIEEAVAHPRAREWGYRYVT